MFKKIGFQINYFDFSTKLKNIVFHFSMIKKTKQKYLKNSFRTELLLKRGK